MSLHKMTNSNGFMELNDDLGEMIKWADEDRIKNSQEAGASFFIGKVRKLSKPRKKGKLLEGIDYEYDSKEKATNVGWSVYYGRLKETGHRAGKRTSRSKKSKATDKRKWVAAIPHIAPTYKNNKEEIYERMIKKMKGE